MSRATISTGSVPFETKSDTKRPSHSSSNSDNCNIVILADFSGRDHRNLNDVATLKQRKIIEVDRDNFDDVFAQLNVQCDLPLAEELMVFTELDDMHPDFIYEHVPLFNKFKQLKRKLKNTSTFSDAVAEIKQWGDVSKVEPEQETSKPQDVNIPSGSLLDDILSGESVSQPSDSFDIQALVKDIVAPYISPKPNPNLKDYIQTVDDASSSLMRKLMHHHQFQTIESAWRSLYLLVRRVETDRKLKIFIVDVSAQELIEDALNADNYEQSNAFKLLVENRQSVGASSFSIIMADAIFGQSESGFDALSNLGEIAGAINASFISGGSEQLADCESLAKTPDRDDWDFSQDASLKEKWQQLRATPQAQHITLVAPRYLSRMPYGKKTSPIDSFAFEELPSETMHPYYLWSCGAWLVTLVMAQNYSHTGQYLQVSVQEVDRLPLHVYYEDDESRVTPCAEINMLDSASALLRETGLLTIRSILNKDSVLIPELGTIASSSK